MHSLSGHVRVMEEGPFQGDRYYEWRADQHSTIRVNFFPLDTCITVKVKPKLCVILIFPLYPSKMCLCASPPSLPPRGLCGVPFCLFRGAAGLPLTSRRADLHGGGPLEAGLSPLTSGLTLSRRLGLSVPPPAPLCCSIPRKTAGGAPSTVPEAGGTQTK